MIPGEAIRYGIFGNLSAMPARRSIAPWSPNVGTGFPVAASSASRRPSVVPARMRGANRPSPAQYDTPRFGAPPLSSSCFQISRPVAGSSATIVRRDVEVYRTPRTKIGTAWLRPTELNATPASATPYCQASFSFETFVVLIWVSGEYRRPAAPPLYVSHPPGADALWAERLAAARHAKRAAFSSLIETPHRQLNRPDAGSSYVTQARDLRACIAT